MNFPLEARNVNCSRAIGAETTQLLDATVAFEPATLNILFGAKGCGKNLLLRLLGLIERPDRGEVLILGKTTQAWTEEQCTEVRSKHFGFVFEAPFLLPSFNVIENIAMPLFKLMGVPPEEAREHTTRVLDFVGMAHCAEAATETLPLWAQLRVSLARALVTTPVALFVENLDVALSDDELISFLELLATARRVFGCTVLVTATSRDLAPFGGRALEFAEGRIVRDWNPGGLLS